MRLMVSKSDIGTTDTTSTTKTTRIIRIGRKNDAQRNIARTERKDVKK